MVLLSVNGVGGNGPLPFIVVGGISGLISPFSSPLGMGLPGPLALHLTSCVLNGRNTSRDLGNDSSELETGS